MAHIVFTLEDGSEIYADLNADIVTVGRHPESLVVLPSGSVSGQHATIKRRGDSYFVQDLGTTNGTRVNGVDVEEVKLEHGDLVSFGDVAGYFYATDSDHAAATWEESANADEHGEEAAPVSAGLPEPDEPVFTAKSEPSVFLPEKYSAVPRTGPRKTGYLSGPSTRQVKRYKESSGIGGFLVFILFLVFAFVVGLHVRHGVEHNGAVLLIDVIEKYKGGSEAAPEAAAETKPAAAGATTPAPAAAPAATPAAPASTPASAPAPAPSMDGTPAMGGAPAPSMDGAPAMGGAPAPAMDGSGGTMMGM